MCLGVRCHRCILPLAELQSCDHPAETVLSELGLPAEFACEDSDGEIDLPLFIFEERRSNSEI